MKEIYAILVEAPRKNRFTACKVTEKGEVVPMEEKPHTTEAAARKAAEKLGLKVERVGIGWDLIG